MLNPFGAAFFFNLFKVFALLTENFGNPLLVFYTMSYDNYLSFNLKKLELEMFPPLVIPRSSAYPL